MSISACWNDIVLFLTTFIVVNSCSSWPVSTTVVDDDSCLLTVVCYSFFLLLIDDVVCCSRSDHLDFVITVLLALLIVCFWLLYKIFVIIFADWLYTAGGCCWPVSDLLALNGFLFLLLSLWVISITCAQSAVGDWNTEDCFLMKLYCRHEQYRWLWCSKMCRKNLWTHRTSWHDKYLFQDESCANAINMFALLCTPTIIRNKPNYYCNSVKQFPSSIFFKPATIYCMSGCHQ